MRRIGLTALLLLTSGCFTYAPIEPSAVAPDMTVRVHLAERVSEPRIEGKVFEVDQGRLSILPEVRPGEASGPRSLARADISEIEVRSLDTGRTLLVAGAGMAVGIGVLLLVEGEPTGGTPGDGGVVFDGVPLLKILLGR